MGCRLVTPTAEVKDMSKQEQTEPMGQTERPSSEKEELGFKGEEPEAEAEGLYRTKDTIDPPPDNPDLLSTNSTLSVAPRTVTSQLSDIVDMCEEMEEGEVQSKSEAILERILRVQYQLEQLGSAATPEIVSRVSKIDTQFQEVLAEYTSKQDNASISAACAILTAIDTELDAVDDQLEHP